MGCPPRLLDKALGAEFWGQTQGVTALNQVFERGRKIKQMFSFSTLQTLFDPPQLFLAQLVLIYSKKRKNLQGCQTSRFSVFWPKLEFFLRGRVMPRIFSDYTVNQHESKSQIKSGKSLAVGIYLIFYFLGGLFSADLIFFWGSLEGSGHTMRHPRSPTAPTAYPASSAMGAAHSTSTHFVQPGPRPTYTQHYHLIHILIIYPYLRIIYFFLNF